MSRFDNFIKMELSKKAVLTIHSAFQPRRRALGEELDKFLKKKQIRRRKKSASKLKPLAREKHQFLHKFKCKCRIKKKTENIKLKNGEKLTYESQEQSELGFLPSEVHIGETNLTVYDASECEDTELKSNTRTPRCKWIE